MFMIMSSLGGLFWTYIYPIIASFLYRLIDLLPSDSPTSRWKSVRKNPTFSYPQSKKQQEHILFYCPSLGEYESIAPIISLLKANVAPPFIEVTFFSPSGYSPLHGDIRHQADHISYCPADTNSLVSTFFDNRKVNHVVISSLALWPTMLEYLYKQNIGYSFVAGSIKKGLLKDIFLSSMSKFINRAKHVIAIDKTDLERLKNNTKSHNITHQGDPRVDGVIAQISKAKEDEIADQYFVNHSFENKKIIFASTHLEDEDIIIPILKDLIEEGYRIIIAPHRSERSDEISKRLASKGISSTFHSSYKNEQQVLVIDKIGILKHLYQSCDLAYVGGGFKTGLHNIAEPLFSNCYTIVGPNISNSYIAKRLENSETVDIIHSTEGLREKITSYVPSDNSIKDIVQRVLSNHLGSADRIYKVLFENK